MLSLGPLIQEGHPMLTVDSYSSMDRGHMGTPDAQPYWDDTSEVGIHSY